MVCGRKALGAAFLCVLILVSLSSLNNNSESSIVSPSTTSSGLLGLVETARRMLHQNFNFVSRRKVPNGPDPIHNRREGNTKLPHQDKLDPGMA